MILLVQSQNTKQFNMEPKRFSYSLYDELGRVYEAGELEDGAAPNSFRNLPATNVNGDLLPNVLDPAVLKPWVEARHRFEVTRTHYDEALVLASIIGVEQKNLRLRVATTTYEDAFDTDPATLLVDDDPTTYEHATHYTYDIHGNVSTMVQDHPQLGADAGTPYTGCRDHRYKHINYAHDLISGNVKRVDYQKDQPDAFSHKYTYDADNRITEVETSADGVTWHRDAKYFYYPHGPLERVELGEHNVQGLDYAYTLQGWIKGINGDQLNPATDMGRDGDLTDGNIANDLIGRDAYAMSLGYYGDEDYKAISPTWSTVTTRPFAPIGPAGTGNTLANEHKALYNGNIAHTVNTLQPFDGWDGSNTDGQVLAQVFQYDQLNRIRKARAVYGLTNTNTWTGVNDDANPDRYRSEYQYDASGNMLNAYRHNNSGARYDSLHYYYERSADGRLLRNRLYHLRDLASDGIVTAPDPEDLKRTLTAFEDDPGLVHLNNNYRYDELGNLAHDTREQIEAIEWTVSGKVKAVTRTLGSTLKPLHFGYGNTGQRIMKQVTDDPIADGTGFREHYVRDAQGNIMATYRFSNTEGFSLEMNERPVYGSSRLGSYQESLELYAKPITAPLLANAMAQVHLNYELSDHLGNVTTVVTGRLLDGNGGGTLKQAELISAQTSEIYGSILPGRNFNSAVSLRGFNGQVKDDEVYGVSSASMTAEFWQYDARVGRRWNLDPKQNPSWSQYSVFSNNPVFYTDLKGDSVGFSDAFRADKDYRQAFKDFVGTEEGYSFLADYAKSGQVIGGRRFENDGKYHQQGVNLVYNVFQGLVSGVDKPSVCGGNGDTRVDLSGPSLSGITINVNLYTGPGWATSFPRLNRVMTIAHESFLHAEFDAQDFTDNCLADYSNVSMKARNSAEGIKSHYHHMEAIHSLKFINGKLNLGGFSFVSKALSVAQQVSDANGYGLSRPQLISALFDYSGGVTLDPATNKQMD